MVNFILTGLNSEVDLNTPPDFPTPASRTISGYHFELGLTMSAASFNNVFYFNTTSPDLSSNSLADDMEFYTISANWPSISFSEGTITSSSDPSGEDIGSYLVANKKTKFIGPAKLATDITGGYNNSDIFSNEDALVTQYETLDTNLKNAIEAKLNLGGDNDNRKSNDDTGANNVSREVLLNLLHGTQSEIQRVNTILQGTASGADAALTFTADDTIVFLITYLANSGDGTGDTVLYPGTNTVHDQKFRVTITLE